MKVLDLGMHDKIVSHLLALIFAQYNVGIKREKQVKKRRRKRRKPNEDKTEDVAPESLSTTSSQPLPLDEPLSIPAALLGSYMLKCTLENLALTCTLLYAVLAAVGWLEFYFLNQVMENK